MYRDVYNGWRQGGEGPEGEDEDRTWQLRLRWGHTQGSKDPHTPLGGSTEGASQLEEEAVVVVVVVEGGGSESQASEHW